MSTATPPDSTPPPPTPPPPRPATPLWWRLAIAAGVVAVALLAYLLDPVIGLRGRAALGAASFIGLAFVFSSDLRAVRWRTLAWGLALQIALALVVLRWPAGRAAFQAVGEVIKSLLHFSSVGGQFVFGALADPEAMGEKFPGRGFVFAFVALPTIVFVSSLFAVLYHLKVLQLVVRAFAFAMRYLMGTSGPETLSVTANVFLGQTEAPLLVRPYVAGMTRSELLALMVGGMAHISGALMAVYIGLGANPEAILTTSIMASPCTLYLAKIMLPETQAPAETPPPQPADEEKPANVIDAAAAGASAGMRLALNIAAMLIAFLGFIALVDALLGLIDTHWIMARSWWPRGWVLADRITLARIFGDLFSPVAFLMGVDREETGKVGSLLGTKLVANEFVAYVEFSKMELSERGKVLATYALTGFANVASIGIQIGGIGGMAPTRRGEIAQLGPRALFAGFLVTLINASIAGVLM
jgi:CNT family concentrative nucleoside transporter